MRITSSYGYGMRRSSRATFGWALQIVGVLVAAVSFASCSTPSESSPDHPVLGVSSDGTPNWVNKGSGAYDGDHGSAFYGVGLVKGIQNPSLSRQTCDNRARGEIAKMFDVYIAQMMKDYQRSTTAGI